MEALELKKLHDEDRLQQSLKMALHIISGWINKNIGSAEHSKAIKM
jgi:hypothetical protein